MIAVQEYLDHAGHSPYAEWFNDLDPAAAAKIATAIIRMGQGNFSNAKGVGGGVYEYRVNYGPGYRIYFGRDGDRLIILLCGGTKKRQAADIRQAIERWLDYKRRRKGQ